VGDNSLKGDNLANETTGDVFALFWKATVLLAEEALSCF